MAWRTSAADIYHEVPVQHSERGSMGYAKRSAGVRAARGVGKAKMRRNAKPKPKSKPNPNKNPKKQPKKKHK